MSAQLCFRGVIRQSFDTSVKSVRFDARWTSKILKIALPEGVTKDAVTSVFIVSAEMFVLELVQQFAHNITVRVVPDPVSTGIIHSLSVVLTR